MFVDITSVCVPKAFTKSLETLLSKNFSAKKTFCDEFNSNCVIDLKQKPMGAKKITRKPLFLSQLMSKSLHLHSLNVWILRKKRFLRSKSIYGEPFVQSILTSCILRYLKVVYDSFSLGGSVRNIGELWQLFRELTD